MSRNNKDKGRLAPFVPYLKETMQHPTWRVIVARGAPALSAHQGALQPEQPQQWKALFADTYSGKGDCDKPEPNRTLVPRTATLRMDHNDAARIPWRRRQRSRATMAPDRVGLHERAAHPRLCAVARRSFCRSKTSQQKTKSRYGKPYQGDTENRIRVIRKTVSLAVRETVPLSPPSGTGNRTKENEPSGTGNRTKSSLTTGLVRAGSERENDEAMPMLPEWTTPKLEEIEYTPELRRLYDEAEKEELGREVLSGVLRGLRLVG